MFNRRNQKTVTRSSESDGRKSLYFLLVFIAVGVVILNLWVLEDDPEPQDVFENKYPATSTEAEVGEEDRLVYTSTRTIRERQPEIDESDPIFNFSTLVKTNRKYIHFTTAAPESFVPGASENEEHRMRMLETLLWSPETNAYGEVFCPRGYTATFRDAKYSTYHPEGLRVRVVYEIRCK